jgi:hypothetical protein
MLTMALRLFQSCWAPLFILAKNKNIFPWDGIVAITVSESATSHRNTCRVWKYVDVDHGKTTTNVPFSKLHDVGGKKAFGATVQTTISTGKC